MLETEVTKELEDNGFLPSYEDRNGKNTGGGDDIGAAVAREVRYSHQTIPLPQWAHTRR